MKIYLNFYRLYFQLLVIFVYYSAAAFWCLLFKYRQIFNRYFIYSGTMRRIYRAISSAYISRGFLLFWYGKNVRCFTYGQHNCSILWLDNIVNDYKRQRLSNRLVFSLFSYFWRDGSCASHYFSKKRYWK